MLFHCPSSIDRCSLVNVDVCVQHCCWGAMWRKQIENVWADFYKSLFSMHMRKLKNTSTKLWSCQIVIKTIYWPKIVAVSFCSWHCPDILVWFLCKICNWRKIDYKTLKIIIKLLLDKQYSKPIILTDQKQMWKVLWL